MGRGCFACGKVLAVSCSFLIFFFDVNVCVYVRNRKSVFVSVCVVQTCVHVCVSCLLLIDHGLLLSAGLAYFPLIPLKLFFPAYWLSFELLIERQASSITQI